MDATCIDFGEIEISKIFDLKKTCFFNVTFGGENRSKIGYPICCTSSTIYVIALRSCGRQNGFRDSIDARFRPTIAYNECGDVRDAFGWSRAAQTGSRYFLDVRFLKLRTSTFGPVYGTQLREPAYLL